MKLRHLILLIALSMPALAAAPATRPTTQPSAEAMFTEGRDALFRRDFAKAIGLLRKAAAADKTKTHYRLHLARALHYDGKAAEAESILADILKTTPDHVEAGQMLGDIHARNEDWRKVVELLEPLLKYRHDYPTYHLLAEAKYNLGDADAARKYFEQAIKLNPASATDHYALGNIYLAGNFFALATDSYNNALRLGLTSPILEYKLGTAYFNLRNYFGNITTATIKSGRPHTISDEFYLIEPVPGTKDLWRVAPQDSAIYHITKAIADGIGNRPDILFLRANIHLSAGRHAHAFSLYKEIEQQVPKDDRPLFYYYFAQSAFGNGQYEQYLSLLNKAIELDRAAYGPTLVEAYLKVAEQYNQNGDLARYIEFLTKAVNESPQTASLHLKLGQAFEENNQPRDASIQYQMTLDLEPDHPKRLELLNLINKATARPSTRPTTRPARR